MPQLRDNPTAERKLHGWLTLFWLLISIPAVVWWKESIPFLVFVSVYANAAGHWASYQSAKGENRLRKDIQA